MKTQSFEVKIDKPAIDYEKLALAVLTCSKKVNHDPNTKRKLGKKFKKSK